MVQLDQWVASLQCQNAGSIPGLAQWVNHGAAKKKKKKKKGIQLKLEQKMDTPLEMMERHTDMKNKMKLMYADFMDRYRIGKLE